MENQQELFGALLEKTRRDVLTNVAKQYTEEAHYNYKQYIESLHAMSISAELQAEQVKEALYEHLHRTSTAVEDWLNTKYGKIQIPGGPQSSPFSSDELGAFR